MRYNPPVQRPKSDALKWFGETIRDTHDHVGIVTEAWIDGNMVRLRVKSETGYNWFTDSEHATIVRND